MNKLRLSFREFKKDNLCLYIWLRGSNRFQTQVCQTSKLCLFQNIVLYLKVRHNECHSVMLDQKEGREIKRQGKLTFKHWKPAKSSHIFLHWYQQSLGDAVVREENLFRLCIPSQAASYSVELTLSRVREQAAITSGVEWACYLKQEQSLQAWRGNPVPRRFRLDQHTPYLSHAACALLTSPLSLFNKLLIFASATALALVIHNLWFYHWRFVSLVGSSGGMGLSLTF